MSQFSYNYYKVAELLRTTYRQGLEAFQAVESEIDNRLYRMSRSELHSILCLLGIKEKKNDKTKKAKLREYIKTFMKDRAIGRCAW